MSADIHDPRVSDIMLERYRLGELPPREREPLDARLPHDDDLRARLDALQRSDEAIRRAHVPELLTAGIRARLEAAGPSTEAAQRHRAMYWAAPALLGALVLLLIAVVPRTAERGDRGDGMSTAAGTTEDRIKGLHPTLTFYRRTANGSETLADGAVAHTGDLLRVGYRAAGRAYGVIVSVDGRRHVTLHLPSHGDRAAPLKHEPTVLLDDAYELDDAPLWERFYFVTSDEPFTVQSVLAAAEQAARTPGTPPATLALPHAFEQSTFSLQKEARP
jgi:hypothetical protein